MPPRAASYKSHEPKDPSCPNLIFGPPRFHEPTTGLSVRHVVQTSRGRLFAHGRGFERGKRETNFETRMTREKALPAQRESNVMST